MLLGLTPDATHPSRLDRQVERRHQVIKPSCAFRDCANNGDVRPRRKSGAGSALPYLVWAGPPGPARRLTFISASFFR